MDMEMLLVLTWILSVLRVVLGAEANLALSDSVNFLDAGLTALGLFTALLTTIMRGRLDAENNTRDLLTYLEGGREVNHNVKLLSRNDTHSLSITLVLVEDQSLQFTKQLFDYYTGTNGLRVDILKVQWLHSHCPPGKECSSAQRQHECRCLVYERIEGVTKHLVEVARGDIFQLETAGSDAITSEKCRRYKCHGFSATVYQDSQHLQQLGPPLPESDSRLLMSVSNMCSDELRTGLAMVEPAGDGPSVTWWDTILEASMTKDNEDRGVLNPFSVKLKDTLDGKQTHSSGVEEYSHETVYLSRLGAFSLSLVLSFLFRTDPFSSSLLARRALRGYTVDKTGTKLPLQAFCGAAYCEPVYRDDSYRIFVTLVPRALTSVLARPASILYAAAVLEALVVVAWVVALAITPWERVLGSSYLHDQPAWAAVMCLIFCTISSVVNVCYGVWKAGGAGRCRWFVGSLACLLTDLLIVALACLLLLRREVDTSSIIKHWLETIFRALVMLSALIQWKLGVDLLGSVTSGTFRGRTTVNIIPYALTYLRLLALVAGGGKWS